MAKEETLELIFKITKAIISKCRFTVHCCVKKKKVCEGFGFTVVNIISPVFLSRSHEIIKNSLLLSKSCIIFCPPIYYLSLNQILKV